MLGQGDTYDWNGSSYNWGWALARYSGATQQCFGTQKRRNDNGGWDPYAYENGAPCSTYVVVEDYYDGSLYDYGQCRMWGYAGAEGGCM